MPILASNIQTQDYQYAVQVPQGTWRWTTRVDVSKAVVSFQVRDIVSPFGLLRDNIPLPGPVVTAMSASITDLQSAFAPIIGLSPSSLTFNVTQGQGFCTPQMFTVSNNGVYGSLLSATVTTSASYIMVTPANVGALAYGAAGMVSVAINATDLVTTSSPYSATLTIQDPNATNTPQTFPITINVAPPATIALSPTSLTFSVSASQFGSVPQVPTQTFQVQNTGPSGSTLNYQIQKLIGLSPWLTGFVPTYGEIPGGSFTNITVSVGLPCPMQPGTYTETLRVSGFSTNFHQDLLVTLIVTP